LPQEENKFGKHLGELVLWKHGWTKVQTMLEQSMKMAKNAGTNNASED
jgi:hypothetical protein